MEQKPNEQQGERAFAAATGYASSWQPVPAGAVIPADAQMMDGQWLFPVFGCDSLDHTVDDFMAEIERMRTELATVKRHAAEDCLDYNECVEERDRLRALISLTERAIMDDAAAITFQSFGQYRDWLLRVMRGKMHNNQLSGRREVQNG